MDDTVDELECRLSRLAMYWRGARDEVEELRLRNEYHTVLKTLWDRGWHGEEMYIDMELPEEYMPDYYLEYWQRMREGEAPAEYAESADGAIEYVAVETRDGRIGYLWACDSSDGSGYVVCHSAQQDLEVVDLTTAWRSWLKPAKAEGLLPSQALDRIHDVPAHTLRCSVVPNSKANAPTLEALRKRAAAE